MQAGVKKKVAISLVIGFVCLWLAARQVDADELKQAFHDAKHEAPCVLYISDTEWLAPRAGSDYEWSPGNARGKPPTFADKELTEVFIREIDGIHDRDDIMLVGSAYRVDVVDQAIIKEKSRFNRKIFVAPTTAKDREGMLKIYLEKIPTLGGKVDVTRLAEITEGFVGWDIENLCKRAVLNAVQRDSDKVEMEDFEAAARQAAGALEARRGRRHLAALGEHLVGDE